MKVVRDTNDKLVVVYHDYDEMKRCPKCNCTSYKIKRGKYICKECGGMFTLLEVELHSKCYILEKELTFENYWKSLARDAIADGYCPVCFNKNGHSNNCDYVKKQNDFNDLKEISNLLNSHYNMLMESLTHKANCYGNATKEEEEMAKNARERFKTISDGDLQKAIFLAKDKGVYKNY